ncbi:MAG: N-acetyltransferase [Chitinophagaceae bacterium]|nr:MAG: N-acetyltransferase [Chitinophagaceae bacterium]
MLENTKTLSDLRPVTDKDHTFLLTLYASTRSAELAVTGWSNEQKIFFLQSQFQLQHNHYQQHFSTAKFHIIEKDKLPIGRLYYGWENNNLRLIDIVLLPEYQRKGIGGRLIRELMDLVGARKGKLLLHVDINKPARDWYLRLGFLPENAEASLKNGVYQQLQWSSV